MSFVNFGLPNSLSIAQGLTVGGTATLAGLVVGVYTVTVNGNATLNQDVSTAGSPTFVSLTLSGGLNNTAIGSGGASTGAFTTLSASSTVSGAGFSTYLASPPAIGGTSAAAGAFTTLSASGDSVTFGPAGSGTDDVNVVIQGGSGTGGGGQIRFYTGSTQQGIIGIKQGFLGGTSLGTVLYSGSGNSTEIWTNGAQSVVFGSADQTATFKSTTASTSTSTGAVVIGNGSSGGLGVGGAINAGGTITAQGFTLNGGGTGTVTASSGVFSITSDRRAKNPHGDFTLGLDAIRHLSPVLYDFKKDEKHLERAGFYTQDVEPWIKQAVFHDSPDGMASLDDRPIIAASVNAIKELDSRTSPLIAEVQSLRKRVAELEAKLAA